MGLPATELPRKHLPRVAHAHRNKLQRVDGAEAPEGASGCEEANEADCGLARAEGDALAGAVGLAETHGDQDRQCPQ